MDIGVPFSQKERISTQIKPRTPPFPAKYKIFAVKLGAVIGIQIMFGKTKKMVTVFSVYVYCPLPASNDRLNEWYGCEDCLYTSSHLWKNPGIVRQSSSFSVIFASFICFHPYTLNESRSFSFLRQFLLLALHHRFYHLSGFFTFSTGVYFYTTVCHRMILHFHPITNFRKNLIFFYIQINSRRPHSKMKLSVRRLIAGKSALIFLKKNGSLASLPLS